MVPVAVLGFSACMVGPSTRTFTPAKRPQGIEADLRLKGARVQGELLEVQDTALLVLRADRVVLVPLRVIKAGRFRNGGALVWNGQASRGTLPRLRLLSRFPAGLTPEVRARLLALYGQTEPEAP
jgi:hypothetical protein